MATIQKNTAFAGPGALVQLAGLVAPFAALLLAGGGSIASPAFGLGLVVGLVLLVAGHMMSKRLLCSECGTKLAHKKVKVCPACGAKFG